MKHTPLTALAILSLALVGCGNTQANDEPQTESAETTTTAENTTDQAMPEKPEGVTQEEWEANLEYAAGNPDSTPDHLAGPTSYPTNADYYFFGDGRVVGKFTLPTEPTEEIQKTFASLLPDDKATFIKVTIDNREGESQYTVNDITGYDADGKEYKYQEFGSSMSEPLWSMWENIDLGDDAEMQQYDELDATLDKYDYNVEPGAIKDVWLISPEADLPDEFSRLGVNGGSSYIGGSDPLPVEMAEFDLDFESPN